MVPSDTWWVDIVATAHISVIMKDCLHYPKPIDVESYVFMGDESKTRVEVVGVFRIQLCTTLYLELEEIFIVLSFRKNLISIFSLNLFGYIGSFGNGNFSVSLNSMLFLLIL